MLILLAALLAVAPGTQEGAAQAVTQLSTAQGAPLADGRYLQFVEEGVLHIEGRYDFPGGRVAIEKAALRLHPEVEQLAWSWSEREHDKLVREMSIDFASGEAVSKHANGDHWEEKLKVEPGKTFAGIGMVVALKALRERLAVGASVELQAIAMTPKPREAKVSIHHDGPERIHMAGRFLEGDRFTIHPEVPAIAKLFVKAPDERVWLFAGKPAAFLRFEGPLVEAGDDPIRIDVVPGPPAN